MPDDLLGLPMRPAKPRERGWTHVIDKGLSLAEAEGVVETAGDYVDVVKLGWGTATITPTLPGKVHLYQSAGIPVMCGGTLLEAAIARGRVADFRRFVAHHGFTHVEVSDGTLQVERASKLELIASLSEEFVVLSEVGSKDAECVFAPYQWVEWIKEELAAGAVKVICEGRESGTAGIYRGDGEVRRGLIDEIVHEIDVDRLIFETPRVEQQAWFVGRFGPDVNLGNIPPDEVIPLETLRLGLRSHTMPQLLLRDLDAKDATSRT
ncbi:MAG TPA: phosphosulfolactate synthase [Gaiellales bacterium]|jgi:phosphosulfolactate synthase|nr:phosphosulfolactate synthase [Gaiellales bacterium]